MRTLLTLALLALLTACTIAAETFTLSSPAIAEGAPIPTRFTCAGPDLSPPLQWKGVPQGTQGLVLLVHDPDAPGGDFVHWMAGLPAREGSLPQGVGQDPGLVQGLNDFGTAGYRGPCPPPGKPHRYVFELVALDRAPSLRPGFTRAELQAALQGHEKGRARFTGTFGRK